MNFSDLIKFCQSHYGFKYSKASYYDYINYVKTIEKLRSHLDNFNETIVVRVSGDDIFYQVVSK